MPNNISSVAHSLGDLFHQACDLYGARTAAMAREGKEFRALSYREVHERVRVMASGLAELHLEKGESVAILAESSMDWAHADWAAQTLGLVVAPIYPTLMPDQVQFIVSDSNAKAVLVGSEELAKKVEGVPTHTFRELLDQGEQHPLDDREWRDRVTGITRENVATIIYTSGTTGNPKGAVLPHRCFLSLVEGIQESLPVDEDDTFLSFLPMAHVYERFAGHVLPLAIGATIAYSGGISTLSKDLQTVRPTVMLLVPRVLEAIRDRIVDGVKKQSKLKQWLFGRALAAGLKRQRGRWTMFGGLLNSIVGQKIRAGTGGRIRFFVSGGAPLAPQVAEFYMAFGLTVLQGYGLTETMAASAVNHPDRNDPTTVGEPIKGLEFKIALDGEILIRGPSVMIGYLNLPEATAEAIDSEGWFHTGDIGELVNGKVRITDRKKDLLILANGKNVAPQPIENKLKLSDFIAEAVLFGDQMDCVCAMIVPNFERVEAYAKEHGDASSSHAELAQLESVKKLIKAEVAAVNQSLADYERVKRFEILDSAFSETTGELTPSLKVKRKFVKEKYADTLAKMVRG